MLRHTLAAAAAGAGVLAGVIGTGSSSARVPRVPAPTPLLTRLTHVSTVGSTVPRNGDVNPYGIDRVSSTTGRLRAGDLLVSNFNDRANKQGTGTSIVELSPGGQRSVFAHITDRTLPGPC